jgi:hypothetical protein
VGGQLPSLVLDKFGGLVFAWIDNDGSVNVGRPNGTGIQSSGGPNVVVASGVVSVSLVRMPAGNPASANDDAIYLFYVAGGSLGSGVVDWTKAVVSGSSYAAWGALNYFNVTAADPSALSTAVDPTSHAIVIAAAPGIWCPPYGCDPHLAIARKFAANDADSNNQTLSGLTNAPVGNQPSVMADRGDVYVFFQDSSGYLAYQGNHGGIWDTAATVLDTSAAGNFNPTVRHEGLGDGNLDVARTDAYSGSNSVTFWRIPRGPQITGLSANPQSVVPLLNQPGRAQLRPRRRLPRRAHH